MKSIADGWKQPWPYFGLVLLWWENAYFTNYSSIFKCILLGAPLGFLYAFFVLSGSSRLVASVTYLPVFSVILLFLNFTFSPPANTTVIRVNELEPNFRFDCVIHGTTIDSFKNRIQISAVPMEIDKLKIDGYDCWCPLVGAIWSNEIMGRKDWLTVGGGSTPFSELVPVYVQVALKPGLFGWSFVERIEAMCLAHDDHGKCLPLPEMRGPTCARTAVKKWVSTVSVLMSFFAIFYVWAAWVIFFPLISLFRGKKMS